MGGSAWNWKLGSGTCGSNTNFWNLMSSSTFSDNKKDIKTTATLPASNSAFGSTNGFVQAEDGSTTTCTKQDGSDAIIEVFFEKDLTNNPSLTLPNWYYYWTKTQPIQDLLTIPGIPLYNVDSCRFETFPTSFVIDLEYDPVKYPYSPSSSSNIYGGSLFEVRGGTSTQTLNAFVCNTTNQEVVDGYNPNFTKIVLGEGCGYVKNKDECVTGSGDHKGIHVLYTTLIHEAEHALIQCEVWNFTHSSDTTVLAGFSSLWDLDRDGYKDIWEDHSADGMGVFETASGTPGPDKKIPYIPGCFCPGVMTCMSTGIQYEETRCRMKEASSTLSVIDSLDWSFDATNVIQGKQWK